MPTRPRRRRLARRSSDGGVLVAAEVAYPPFAYALSFNGSDVWPTGEITSWVHAPCDDLAETVDLDLVRGFTCTAFPADLRSRGQIERAPQQAGAELAEQLRISARIHLSEGVVRRGREVA